MSTIGQQINDAAPLGDGGPAFPRDHAHDGHNGMTLRDYFAAKALSGLVVNGENFNTPVLAAYSYEMADAMLKARHA